MNKAMSLYNQNPFMFYFSVITVAAMVIYFGYLALDRLGLPTKSEIAVVIAKRHYRGGEAPIVNIAAGRPWVQSQLQPDMFLLSFRSNNEQLNAAVSQETFEAVKPGDAVNIVTERRRLSGLSVVIDITRI